MYLEIFLADFAVFRGSATAQNIRSTVYFWRKCSQSSLSCGIFLNFSLNIYITSCLHRLMSIVIIMLHTNGQGTLIPFLKLLFSNSSISYQSVYASSINFHFLSIQVYFSPSDNLIQNLSKPTIASYSVKERRSHTAMVAKFLGLSKLWSCQYGGEKTTTKIFVHYCT